MGSRTCSSAVLYNPGSRTESRAGARRQVGSTTAAPSSRQSGADGYPGAAGCQRRPPDPGGRFRARSDNSHGWGNNSISAGTFALYAALAPKGDETFGTDKFTAIGLDAQYQDL